jgi:hypothetical protein
MNADRAGASGDVDEGKAGRATLLPRSKFMPDKLALAGTTDVIPD